MFENDHEETKNLDDFTRLLEGKNVRLIDGEFIGDTPAGVLTIKLGDLALALRTRGFGARYLDPDHPNTDCVECGHKYERHFDGYDNNREVGCKYCQCSEFHETFKLKPSEE